MSTYLVSGESDIEPTSENLRQSGRQVRHGAEVSPQATDVLVTNGRFVVIAHGDSDGTIFWSTGEVELGPRWLWVGMAPVPEGARVYLYCCKAGPELTSYLDRCQCVGHCDVVPMPVEPDTEIIMRFLDEVDRLMDEDEFDRAEWRSRLLRFVTERLNEELLETTSVRAPCLWLMLSRSLQV